MQLSEEFTSMTYILEDKYCHFIQKGIFQQLINIHKLFLRLYFHLHHKTGFRP